VIGAIAWLAGPGPTAVNETNLQIKVLTTQVRIRYDINTKLKRLRTNSCTMSFGGGVQASNRMTDIDTYW
jgi:hypothetical protein